MQDTFFAYFRPVLFLIIGKFLKWPGNMLLVAIEGDKSEQIFYSYQNVRMISIRYLAKSQQCLEIVSFVSAAAFQ